MRAMWRMMLSAALLWPVAAWAQSQAETAISVPNAAKDCDVPAYLLSSDSPLNKVREVIKGQNKLDVLVIGSRSSSLAASTGSLPISKFLPNNPTATSGPPDAAYPGRLQQMLREKLPTLAISVSVDLQPKKTAEDIAAGLTKSIEVHKPDLVVWQTGTVDAMRGIDSDEFRSAMDGGVATLQKAGTDVILMNLQYSPRTDTMTSPTPYVDNMRVVAQEHNVPLFDRYAMMRHWHENGDFDLFSPSSSIDLAKQVHECLARALATFVIEASRVNTVELKVQR